MTCWYIWQCSLEYLYQRRVPSELKCLLNCEIGSRLGISHNWDPQKIMAVLRKQPILLVQLQDHEFWQPFVSNDGSWVFLDPLLYYFAEQWNSARWTRAMWSSSCVCHHCVSNLVGTVKFKWQHKKSQICRETVESSKCSRVLVAYMKNCISNNNKLYTYLHTYIYIIPTFWDTPFSGIKYLSVYGC